MTETRKAEIAGGGIAGLSLSVALAQRGWRVRVHERSSRLRALGSGIFLSENGLSVLEALGAYEDAVREAFPLRYRETRDGNGHLITRYDWNTEQKHQRQFMLLRKHVLESLGAAAAAHGVQILTGSKVVNADENGCLELATGEVNTADLVVAADGVNSRIPGNNGLGKSRKKHRDGSIRMLLPCRSEFEWPAGVFREYWSGRRRCFVVPCSHEELYLGFVALENDEAACRVPIDKESWISSFPVLEEYISKVDQQERWSWDQYQTVKLHSWRKGRLAVLGDAAHCMSPNFGQGGGLAMCSAMSLAAHLARSDEMARALNEWESRERPMIEDVQRLSALYSAPMKWPPKLRLAALKAMGRSSWMMRKRTQAFHYRPYGIA